MAKPTDYSPIIKDHAHQTALVNQFYNGIDTAKAHILKYEKESDEGYKQRLEMARLNNYVAQAIDSIAQIVMRKPIDISEIKPPLLDYIDTIDYQNNINRFATDLLYATAKDGFTFVLVDKDGMEEVTTKADVSELRPYAVHIKRERVRSFKQDSKGNFTSFVYDESYTEDSDFVDEVKVQQRAFRIIGGQVVSEIYRDDELVAQTVSGLDYIPVVMVHDDDIPRFYNLAKINANHLNLKSENRDNLRKLLIVPLMWSGGDNSGKLEISTTTGIKFTGTPSECDFQYRSPDSSFMGVQENAIKEEETAARTEISELFEGKEKTATEVEILNTKNESVLSLFASLVEDGINRVLEIMADYQDTTFDAMAKVNRDFLSNKLTSEQMNSLRLLYTDGVITHERYLKTLVTGEVINLSDDEIEVEVEKATLG